MANKLNFRERRIVQHMMCHGLASDRELTRALGSIDENIRKEKQRRRESDDEEDHPDINLTLMKIRNTFERELGLTLKNISTEEKVEPAKKKKGKKRKRNDQPERFETVAYWGTFGLGDQAGSYLKKEQELLFKEILKKFTSDEKSISRGQALACRKNLTPDIRKKMDDKNANHLIDLLIEGKFLQNKKQKLSPGLRTKLEFEDFLKKLQAGEQDEENSEEEETDSD